MELEVKTSKKGLDISLLVLRIIYLVLYILITAYVLWVGISELINSKQNPEGGLYGLGFVLVLLTFGSIIYGVATLISIAKLIISIVNKNASKRKLNIVFSVIGMIIPYLTEVVLLYTIGQMF